MIGRQFCTNLKSLQNNKTTFKDLYLITKDDYSDNLVNNYIDEFDKKFAYYSVKFITNIDKNLNIFFDRLKNTIQNDLSSIDVWLLFLKMYFNITDETVLDKCVQILISNRAYKDKLLNLVDYIKSVISDEYKSKLIFFNSLYSLSNVDLVDVLKQSILDYIDKYRVVIILYFRKIYDPYIRLMYRYMHDFSEQFYFDEDKYKTDFKDIVANKIKYNLIPTKHLKYFFIKYLLNSQNIHCVLSNVLTNSEYKLFVNYIEYRFIYELSNQLKLLINDNTEFESPDDMYDYILDVIKNNEIIKKSLQSAILKFKEFSDLINYTRYDIINSNTVKENLRLYETIGSVNIIQIIPELYELCINLLYCPSDLNQTYMFNNVNIINRVIDLLNNTNNIDSPSNKINILNNNAVLYSGNLDGYNENDLIINNIKNITDSILSKIDEISDLFLEKLNNEFKIAILKDFESVQLKDISLSASKIIYNIIMQSLYNFTYGFFVLPLVNEIQKYSSTDYEYLESSISNIVYNIVNKKSAEIYTYVVNKLLTLRESLNVDEINAALDKIYDYGSNVDLTNILNIILSPIENKTFVDDFDFESICNEIKQNLYDFCLTNISNTDFKFDLEIGNITYFSDFDNTIESFIFNIKNRINFDLIKSIHSIKHSIIGNTDKLMKTIDDDMYFIYVFKYVMYILFYNIILIRSGLVNFLFSNHLKKDIYITINKINFGEDLDMFVNVIFSDLIFKDFVNLVNNYIIL